MKEIKTKKKKDKVAATLMLCFCVIALTSIFTIKANIDKIKESAKEVTVSEDASVSKDSRSKEDSTEGDSSKDSSLSANASNNAPIVDSRKEETKQVNFTSPIIGGRVTKEFSMDMVIYSNTLDQFMTHPGCDIVSSQSDNVIAAAAGTVTDISTCDRYGKFVEITHSSGIISRYYNLSDDIKVEKGDLVAMGQSLGTVGSSALYESADEPHLHLEFIQNGVTKDPAQFISF